MTKRKQTTEDAYHSRVMVEAKRRAASTPEQREARRAKRWKKTGVSDATLAWMKERGML